MHGVGQGLLAVNVKALVDGPDRSRSVVMIGGADDDRIDSASLGFDHFPVVDIGPGVLELRLGSIEVVGVDVAQRDDVLAFDTVDVGRSPVGRAHAGDPQLLIR